MNKRLTLGLLSLAAAFVVFIGAGTDTPLGIGGGSGGSATGVVSSTPYVVTYAATIAPDVVNSNFQTVTLTGNTTLNPAAPAASTVTYSLTLAIAQDATGSRTVAQGANITCGTSLPWPVATTTASKTDFYSFRWLPSASKWELMAFGAGY